MAIIQSDWAKLIRPYPFPQFAAHVVQARFFIAVTAAQLVLNNIFEIAPLPAGCVPVDLVLDCDDIDTATGAVLDVGIMSGAFADPDQARTIGAEFVSGSTLGQTGGVFRPTLVSAFRVGANSNLHRSIGVKVATAPTTPVAGSIGLTLSYTTVP